jgi:hypothetical protein
MVLPDDSTKAVPPLRRSQGNHVGHPRGPGNRGVVTGLVPPALDCEPAVLSSKSDILFRAGRLPRAGEISPYVRITRPVGQINRPRGSGRLVRSRLFEDLTCPIPVLAPLRLSFHR